MGIEHERIHLETSSVLIRQLPLDVLRTTLLEHRESLSSAILVLLAWDDARRDLVEALQATGLPLLILVVVPAGTTLEAGGNIAGAGRNVEFDLEGPNIHHAPSKGVLAFGRTHPGLRQVDRQDAGREGDAAIGIDVE